MKNKKLIISMIALAMSLFANAQKEIPDSARELLFDKAGALTRVVATDDEVAAKIITQNPLLDDVPWRRVILRVIDLREEQNKSLYYPYQDITEESQKNLFAILYYNFIQGKLIGYKDVNNQDQTRVPLFTEENRVNPNDTVSFPFGQAEYLQEYQGDIYGQINQITQSCIKYYIQEAWYFDKHTSTFHSKILAIAPLFDGKYNNQLLANYSEDLRPNTVWFWFPYESVRPFLQAEYMRMSAKNTKQLLNFDDFFTQRKFYSYIIKDYDMNEEDLDREIKENDETTKVIRIRETQDRIEGEILDFEQDLWNY